MCNFCANCDREFILKLGYYLEFNTELCSKSEQLTIQYGQGYL